MDTHPSKWWGGSLKMEDSQVTMAFNTKSRSTGWWLGDTPLTKGKPTLEKTWFDRFLVAKWLNCTRRSVVAPILVVFHMTHLQRYLLCVDPPAIKHNNWKSVRKWPDKFWFIFPHVAHSRWLWKNVKLGVHPMDGLEWNILHGGFGVPPTERTPPYGIVTCTTQNWSSNKCWLTTLSPKIKMQPQWNSELL